MKKLLLFSMILGIAISAIAQDRAVVSKELRNFAVKKGSEINVVSEFEKVPGIPAYKSINFVEEEVIGETRYDLQTNTSIQNRIHVYDDGTVGAVWTMGFADPGFAGRGTGYNYFDGNSWGPYPTARIESIRTGWPSYAPYGENGELVVSHDFGNGSLYYLTRSEKGTGDWTEDELLGPSGVQVSWNRSTTSGVDNSVMQVLSITWPTANGGPIYEGLDGAILYSRSSDGGATWEMENTILDGMTSDEYTGFSADDYEWAASKGDNIAFLVGDSWFDMFMMKSADGGDTWEKTVIWEHPYPFWAGEVTDTFYCVDGAHHLAFDSQNKVHVVFGINRTYSDGATSYWFPFVDGVGYWNEDMPTFSDDLNALNPYSDAPYTELEEDYNLIGWMQDLNGNGEIDVLGEAGAYFIGASSQPQIVIDETDFIYIAYSSITESYDNGAQDFRHLWARGSWGESVWGEFNHLTADLIHIFDECVFPSAAPYTDDYFYLVYQTDQEPGLAVRGDEDEYTDNNINFMKVMRNDLIPIGIEEAQVPIHAADVSQNYPNPFTGSSYVNVEVRMACTLSLEVTNLVGQVVYTIPEKDVNPGTTRLEIRAENLTPGVYFYSVKAGDSTVTKKMVIE